MKTAIDGTALENPPQPVRIDLSLSRQDDRIVLNFGQSISWLEMEPVVAIRLAEAMKEKAVEILRSEPT